MLRFICILGFAVALCHGLETEVRNPVCQLRNAYYKFEKSCDKYIECREYVAHEMLCPDGLNFNPEARWPDYPCGYPMDVPCLGRELSAPAHPTAECPRQFGFYPSLAAAADDCGRYRMCVEGKAIEMLCPSGLAFNPETARCDWPDLVPSCDAHSFLRFTCPESPIGADGLPIDEVVNYRFPNNCYAFYSCENGRARLLSCDAGFAFNPATGRCEDSELVHCIDGAGAVPLGQGV